MALRCHSVRIPCGDWWRKRQDLNLHAQGALGEPAFEAGAMPFRSRFRCGGPDRDRTGHLLDAIQASPHWDFRPVVVVLGGIEPPSIGYQPIALPLSYRTLLAGMTGVEPARALVLETSGHPLALTPVVAEDGEVESQRPGQGCPLAFQRSAEAARPSTGLGHLPGVVPTEGLEPPLARL